MIEYLFKTDPIKLTFIKKSTILYGVNGSNILIAF